jgi:hypothetical protein
MAWPAAEAAPDAPKVQKRYKAERAGIARPEVMAVVYIHAVSECVFQNKKTHDFSHDL